MQKKRPKGVTIFGILFLIGALFSAFYTLKYFSIFTKWWLIYTSILYILLVFAAGVGLLMLKGWARKLSLGFAIFFIIRQTYNGVRDLSYVYNQEPSVFVISSGILILILCLSVNCLLFWYLSRPKIKEQFNGR